MASLERRVLDEPQAREAHDGFFVEAIQAQANRAVFAAARGDAVKLDYARSRVRQCTRIRQ